jgi:hypothetical protein
MLQPRYLPTGHHHAVVLLLCLALSFGLLADVASGSTDLGDGETITDIPDIRIVGWTVDDTLAGNGDGGLHPGETALLQIFLSNQGNETARNVAATLFEVSDHPDIEILDKFALWPDLVATGVPGASSTPHFRIQVAQTRPCYWEIPFRLEITAAGGYLETREFTLVMVDPRSTDLAKGAGRPFYFGADVGDFLGGAIATGDLDGDGFDDLILGSATGAGPANARFNAGEVAIVYGGPARPADADLASPPADMAFIFGADGDDSLGTSIAAGDFDGDGFDDLILGAWVADGPASTRFNAGEVVVVYGGPVRLADIDLALPPAGIAFVFGADVGDVLGAAAAAGDLDGDGFSDLILGVRSGNGPANARNDAGEVVVLYGGPTRLPLSTDLLSPPANAAFVFGADVNDSLGWSVTSGDVDGDGFDDLTLGAPGGAGPANARNGAGEVVVVYGGPARLTDTDLASPPAGVAFIFGAGGADNLGRSVATGDLDGDGSDDLILEAAFGDGPANDRNSAGEVAIIYGGASRLANIDLASTPAGIAFVFGADTNDNLGTSVVATGDLDGDGFDDLILGANGGDGPANSRNSVGEVAVVYGGPARHTDIDLASPPADIAFVFGTDAGDFLGASLAAGDLDGDGFDDLILGALGGNGSANTRADSGEVAVISGSPRSRYRHDSDTFSFIDATIGTDLGLGCDDCATTLPIGFDFNYYGRVFDTLTVSSNGYLTFNGPGNLPAGFCPPASNPPNETIAVLWDDWNPAAGGSVHALLEGSAPNRRLTIEWAGVPLFPATGAATFEVTLFETTDQILMQYQDTIVGDVFSDSGATAVVGLENGVGVNGVAASCFTATVADLSARRFRRFASPTVVFSENVETGAAGWTMAALTGPPTPLWHVVSEPACTPSSRSGNSAFYYGQDGTCDYETVGTTNSGILTSPLIPALPQDAALSFWHRRDVELEAFSTFDQSFVEAQGNGGGFSIIKQLETATGAWRLSEDFLPPDPLNGAFSPLDLTGFTGQDLDLRFRFDTIDDAKNVSLGWMIDDITINACPVFAPGGVAAVASQALVTAQPEVICETSGGRVDAIGSYCSGCGTGLSYQWSQDGLPIGGATSIVYDIPMGGMPGISGYSVGIECASNPACITESTETTVTVVAQPEVADTLSVNRTGSDLAFQWTDVATASDYVLFSSTTPDGAFTDEAATAPSGSPGVIIPVPAEDVVFYLVAGRNSVCGTGLKNNFATP